MLQRLMMCIECNSPIGAIARMSDAHGAMCLACVSDYETCPAKNDAENMLYMAYLDTNGNKIATIKHVRERINIIYPDNNVTLAWYKEKLDNFVQALDCYLNNRAQF